MQYTYINIAKVITLEFYRYSVKTFVDSSLDWLFIRLIVRLIYYEICELLLNGFKM